MLRARSVAGVSLANIGGWLRRVEAIVQGAALRFAWVCRIESMAGVFHISEAEAAPDFAAVMRRVRAGDEVVVEEDGGRAIAVLRAPREKS
jgi:hypothetical protein